jgi:hypothetical protein
MTFTAVKIRTIMTNMPPHIHSYAIVEVVTISILKIIARIEISVRKSLLRTTNKSYS